MKLDEGTARPAQFKMTIQALLFVMLQLYHLLGQNETHYSGYSASQSVQWGTGCNLAVLPSAKQIQPIQGLILFLFLAPQSMLPFYLLLHDDQ